ncbi:hypothetical protein G9A89_005072 [Geosiphon pyriformis]|nr:hypothetical protein G9A89_005072 [Geosiphon pyriformis]
MFGLDEYFNQIPASKWSLLGFLASRTTQSDFTGLKDKEHYRYQMSLKAVRLSDEFTAAEKEKAKLCPNIFKWKLYASTRALCSLWPSHAVLSEGMFGIMAGLSSFKAPRGLYAIATTRSEALCFFSEGFILVAVQIFIHTMENKEIKRTRPDAHDCNESKVH